MDRIKRKERIGQQLLQLSDKELEQVEAYLEWVFAVRAAGESDEPTEWPSSEPVWWEGMAVCLLPLALMVLTVWFVMGS